MTVKFACPKCGKSIKADAQLAGKTAKCPVCTTKLKIPAARGVMAAAGAATGRASSSPLSPMTDGGPLPFDDDEWEAALNPYQAPEAETEKEKIPRYAEPAKVSGRSLRWTRRGLKTYYAGLSGAGICLLITLALGWVGLADNEGLQTFLAVVNGFYAFFGLLILVGPYLCITVPEKTKAKQMAIVSATAQTLAIIAVVAFLVSAGQAIDGAEINATDAAVYVGLIVVASMVSYFSFVQFLKKLADFIGEKEVAGAASTVIMIGVLEYACIVMALIMPTLATNLASLAWLGMASLLCLITSIVGGFIAVGMYVKVIENLCSALPRG